MRRAAFSVAALLVAVPAAGASHPSRQFTLRANLDGDRAIERVVVTEDVSFDHSQLSTRVVVLDACRGRQRAHPVVDARASLLAARFVQADGRGRTELLAAVGGPLGNLTDGKARVVRLVAVRGGCPRLKTLFSYAASSPPLPAPEGFVLSSFEVNPDELERRYRGREVVLVEWYRSGAALASRARTSVYRFATARDRYVLLRSFLATVP
jgi:hypothetical protein